MTGTPPEGPSSTGDNGDSAPAEGQFSVYDVLARSGLLALGKEPLLDAVRVALEHLGALTRRASDLERALVREGAIRELQDAGIQASALIVDAAMMTARESDDAKRAVVRDCAPWPFEVAGAVLLDEIVAVLRRHVVMTSEHAAEAVALWIVFTHAIDSFQVAPRLAITSPQKRCGKTTLLTLVAGIVCRKLSASSISSSAVFWSVDRYRPTLLIDEADTFLPGNEELRGVLDSGHFRPSAAIVRREPGGDSGVRPFNTFGPVAVALIGKLSGPLGTVEDRSVLITMRRRAADEKIERLRIDKLPLTTDPLQRRAARFAIDHTVALRDADPDVPAALHDRAADNWRPLIAIADAAGGEWPARARLAALALSGEMEDDAAAVQLFADLRALFRATSATRLSSADIVSHLVTLEARDWGDWKHSKPINTHGVARLLKPFGIEPRMVRIGNDTVRGYVLDDFQGAFKRYLPAEPAEPIEPVEPAEPAEPTEPAEPAEPAEPGESGEAAEPDVAL